MKKIALALAALSALGACATSETQKSYTPPTVVVVKAPKGRSAQANYQVSPEANLTGSGGSAK